MIKKIGLLVLLIFLPIAIPATLFLVKQQQEIRQKAAPSTTMSLIPTQKTVSVGETFSLDVNINTGENSIVATSVHLTFDPTKLQAQSIVNSPQFPNILSSGDVSQVGKVSITVGTSSITRPFKGIGTIAIVRFRAIQPSDTPVRISFAQESFVGSIGEGSKNALIGTTPATIIISSQENNITPTLTMSPTETISPTISIISTPSATIKTSPEVTQTIIATGRPTPSPTSIINKLTLSSHENGQSTIEDPPKLSGKAEPNSTIVLSFYPGSSTGAVTADSMGNWSFTPSQKLGLGTYIITITSTNPTTGANQTITSTLTISSIPSITTSPTINSKNVSPSPSNNQVPITGLSKFTNILVTIAVTFIAIGIALSFSLK